MFRWQGKKIEILHYSKKDCSPFGYLYFHYFHCFYVIASIAYIHPVYGARVSTHDLLIMSHLPLPLDHGSLLKGLFTLLQIQKKIILPLRSNHKNVFEMDRKNHEKLLTFLFIKFAQNTFFSGKFFFFIPNVC
jgi:hypothetical protein